MVSAVLGRHFGQDGLLGALVGFGGVCGAWSLFQQEEQEILDLLCKKWAFGSMAPRLLAGNSQKSCSRLSAVHIFA